MSFFKKTAFKTFALLLCLCLLCASLCSCDKKGSGKSVSWLLSESPRNLDPQTASSQSELLIIKNCFKGLFEKNSDGELFSSMVESYSVSPDGLSYSFKLYDDIYWSIYEGREIKKYAPITSHDFAFSIKRLFTDNPDADIMKTLKFIKNADKVLSGQSISKLSVYCKDDKTLNISLKEKNAAFLEAFCDPLLFPCCEQFFNSTSGRYGLSAQSLVFNGSFVLSSWGESSIRLLSNTLSSNAAIASGVTLYLPKSTREPTALLQKGDIDAALLSSDEFERIEKKEDFKAEKTTSVVWALVFNQNHELWKNTNLRSAVISCTDMSVLSSKNESHYSVAKRIIPDTALCHLQNYYTLTPSAPSFAYDVQNAKTLYSKALSELSLTRIYNAEILIPEKDICKETFSALNQIYQRELSLYFSQSYLSEQAVINAVRSGDFAAALVPLYISGSSPMSALSYFSQSSTSCLIALDNEFSAHLQNAADALAAQSAADCYLKAETALYSSSIIMPLYFENSYFVTSKELSGFSYDGDGTVLFGSVK